jgi:hypothetical protein
VVFVEVTMNVMLARLNISSLNFRRKHLDALFLNNVFKNKICCSSIFDSVSIWIFIWIDMTVKT